MTKMEIVHEVIYFDFKTLSEKLDHLLEEGRITSGARYYVYNPYQIYSYTQIRELISRASKSKDYTRYIKRQSSTQMNLWLQDFRRDVARIQEFVDWNTKCRFQDSQRQVLLATGEYKEDEI